MIDSDWLEQVQCESVNGLRLAGLAGIGSKTVGLILVDAAGEKFVVRLPKQTLAFHIKEIPPILTIGPQYSLGAVNAKLRNLVGHARLDTMSVWLDEMYTKLVHMVATEKIRDLALSCSFSASREAARQLILTQPLARRLNATLDEATSYVEENIGGSMAPKRTPPIQWRGLDASSARAAVEKTIAPEFIAGQRAANFFDNPLILWGVAAMEGFFTDAEMPGVAKYIESEFGYLPTREDGNSLAGQADAVANFLAQYLNKAPVDRFVFLCEHAGILIEARDKRGEIVAGRL